MRYHIPLEVCSVSSLQLAVFIHFYSELQKRKAIDCSSFLMSAPGNNNKIFACYISSVVVTGDSDTKLTVMVVISNSFIFNYL